MTMHCFTPPLTPELQFALSASKTATAICRTSERKLHMTKPDSTPVCTADLLIQARIHDMLRTTFPGDALLAEETLDAERATQLGVPLPDCPAKPSGREWVLDPIDGTTGFLNGGFYATGLCLPDVCAAVAIPEEGTVLLGGKGAIRVQRLCAGVTPASGGWLVSGGDGVLPPWGQARQLCCGSLVKYAAVARGEARVFVQVVKGGERVWDHAAGLFVVDAAGGKVSDETGGNVKCVGDGVIVAGRAIVASAPGVGHKDVCRIVERALREGDIG